uniref:Uncharacterized protein n=1 Tax=Magallana gigas TaxID=29159 RepID=A0A8W8LQ01_MAGGI
MFRIQVPDSIDDKRPIYHMLHLNSISENLRTRYIERPPLSSPQLSPVNVDHGSPYLLRKARMFLDKFKRLNFTKNPEKYIKYSVQDVAEVVDTLFDMSA